VRIRGLSETMVGNKDYFGQYCGKHRINVTIGLCVRNEEKTVEESIRSIVDQDFPHELMELIVVEDGSEDGTLSRVLDLVQKIDLRTTVFHSKWRGIGPARNTVIENADGEYIVWVDGGMILPKDHVRKQIEFMEKNRNVGIAKAKCGMTESLNLVSALESLQYLAFDLRYDGKVDSFVIGVGGSAYRVKAAKEVGGFDSRIKRSGEDFDIENRMRDIGWSIYRTSALFYRKHNSTWRSIWYEGVKYGIGGYYLIHKYKERVLNRTIISALDGILNARIAYKLTRRKIAFLLPFHHALKKIAWLFGFLKTHLNKNEPCTHLNTSIVEEPRIIYSK